MSSQDAQNRATVAGKLSHEASLWKAIRPGSRSCRGGTKGPAAVCPPRSKRTTGGLRTQGTLKKSFQIVGPQNKVLLWNLHRKTGGFDPNYKDREQPPKGRFCPTGATGSARGKHRRPKAKIETPQVLQLKTQNPSPCKTLIQQYRTLENL